MTETYLLFKRGESGEVVNSFLRWGIVCCKVPFKAGCKTKSLATRNWSDEDGEDAYVPSQLRYESYDAEFEFAYKGEELASNVMNLGLALTQIELFKTWLSGKDGDVYGASLSIYSPYSCIGRQGCYLLSISDEAPCVIPKQHGSNLYHENVVTFKATFRVTDPVNNVILAEP